jgi:glutathione S-transferase
LEGDHQNGSQDHRLTHASLFLALHFQVQRFWEEAYGESESHLRPLPLALLPKHSTDALIRTLSPLAEASKGLETRFDTELNRLYKLLDDRLGQQKYVGLKDRVTIADVSRPIHL